MSETRAAAERLWEYGGQSVHSNQDAIRKFCQLQSMVADSVFDYQHPADCFCGKSQGKYIAPVRTYEDGYRNDLAAYQFIRQATLKAIAEATGVSSEELERRMLSKEAT